MTKAAIIFAVVAFCAFVASVQSTVTNPFFTDPPPTRRPLTGPILGYLKFCDSVGNCWKLGVDNYSCNNVLGYENDAAVTVDTKHCFYLFEHIDCEGKRVRVGPDCYQDDCCPSKNLDDCKFGNMMTSYMLC